MSNPTFKPNDVVWHVRHGKVTLQAYNSHLTFHIGDGEYWHGHSDGKEESSDVGRVLYTLDEARAFGWLKEPRVVEFECTAGRFVPGNEMDGQGKVYVVAPQFYNKRVRVRVEEVQE